MRSNKEKTIRRWLAALAALCPTQAATAQAVLEGDPLQEVVVTGTGTRHLLKDAPVQTEVISGQQLKAYGGRTIEDILGGLTATFAFSEDDMGSQIQMNGLGNSYILILIDGKRIHGDIGGENDLSLIDPNNIDKIEIVKGASSALYGSDAIAGVINIITRKHTQQGLQLENITRGGTYGDLRQHNSLALNHGKWGSHTNFQLQHTDGWQNTAVEHTAAGEQPITDTRNKTVNRHTSWQVAQRLTYAINKDIQLYAEGTLHGKRIYRPSGKYARYDVHTYDLQYRNQNASLGGKWQLNQTDQLTLDVDWNRHAYHYYYTANTLVEDYEKSRGTLYYPYYPYLPDQTELQSDQQRTLANLKGIFALPSQNQLSTGLEYRHDWLKAPTRVLGGKASDWTAALYLQDEWRWPGRGRVAAHLTAGLRLNHNQQFGWRLTPKLSAMLKLSRPWRIRATWSQGFKTPTTKEQHYRYIRQMSGTYLYLGNKDLRPQTSNYFALSGEYTHAGWSLTLTGYHNRVRDMIALVTIPNYQAPDEYIIQYDPVKTRQYQNIEDAKTYGVDLNLRYAWKDLAIGASYSYLDTKANQYDTNHDRMHNVTIDGMAHHKATCFATWSHTISPAYRIGMGLYGRISSKRHYQINGNGKGYQVWRLTTTHDLGNSKTFDYRIEAGVDNLFNYIDKTAHGLHLGTTTPGTTLYASLTIRFHQGKQPKDNFIKNNNTYNPNSNRNNEED